MDAEAKSSFLEPRKCSFVETQSCSPTATYKKGGHSAFIYPRSLPFSRRRNQAPHSTSSGVIKRFNFSPVSRPSVQESTDSNVKGREVSYQGSAVYRPRETFKEDGGRRLFEKENPVALRGCSMTSTVPVRIFVPSQYTDALDSHDEDFSPYIKKGAVHITTQMVSEGRVSGVIVSISWLDKEALWIAVFELCRKMSALIPQSVCQMPGPVCDADWLVRGIVLLIPDRAVSRIIGYKGTTINRICKRFSCDIRMIPTQKMQYQFTFADRLMLLRGADVSNVARAICHIDSLMNGLIRKRRLSEADFSYQPTCVEGKRLSLQTSVARLSKSVPSNAIERPTVLDDNASLHGHKCGVSGTLDPYWNVRMTPTVASSSWRVVVPSEHRMEGTPRGTIDTPPFYPFPFSVPLCSFRHIMHSKRDYMSLKLVINKHHAAWVIGNLGARKKWLEMSSGAMINIYNRSIENLVDALRDSRVMILRGTPVALSLAVNAVFVGYDSREPYVGGAEETRVCLILSRASSSVLLKRGVKTLRTIARQSGVKVSLLQHLRLNPHIISLEGNTVEKVTALLLMLEYILRKKKGRDGLQPSELPSQNPSHSLAKRPRGEYVCEKQGTLKKPAEHVPDTDNSLGTPRPSTIVEPPEASFLRYASNNVTYPRVITTSSKYSISVTFPPKYRALVSRLGMTSFDEIEAMVNYRVGSSVHILRRDQVPAGSSPGDTSVSDREMQQEPTADIPLQFELTGTPIGNSTAVLLLHEVMINLETCNVFPGYEEPSGLSVPLSRLSHHTQSSPIDRNSVDDREDKKPADNFFVDGDVQSLSHRPSPLHERYSRGAVVDPHSEEVV